MSWILLQFLLFFSLSVVYCKKDPEADLRKLPKLFHLDDFEQCLERKDGVYCLGKFDIYSDVQPNPLYDLILEKSQDSRLYNRSYLHRGYCLPTRCPGAGGEANATARFERCVDAWARRHELRARLRTLHYCRAHGQPRPRAPDTSDLPHRVLLYFVYTMLVMAVVGTVYDIFIAKKGSKNPLLMSFSVRINWSQLITNFEDVDPRLKQLGIFSGLRFCMGIGMVLCHVFILTTASYQRNPRVMEKLLFSPTGFALGSSMIFTLTFVLISNFLTSYNILVIADKHRVNFTLTKFPLLVFKRLTRMYPVYLLLNGFAATWWKSFGDGPLWPLFVASESEICRKKFWVTAAFLQNLINKKELCLVQTWIMAVDMQLQLFTLFVTLVLVNRRQHAIKVFSALLVAATALLAHQAFAQDLIPTYLYMTPEVFTNFFIGADSFFDLYIHPINGVIAAIIGSMLAFILFDHQNRGVNYSNSKIFLFLNWIALPVVFLWWGLSYAYFRHYDRTTQHVMVVVERLFIASLTAFYFYSSIYIKGFMYKVFSMRSLKLVARISLAMSMSHWCIIVLMMTDRWTLHDSSALRIVTDVISVYVLANIVAVPLTLLVEEPLQNFLNRILTVVSKRKIIK